MEVQISTVVQAVFLEHAGNLILFPQKAASGEEKKKRLFICELCFPLFAISAWGKGKRHFLVQQQLS